MRHAMRKYGCACKSTCNVPSCRRGKICSPETAQHDNAAFPLEVTQSRRSRSGQVHSTVPERTLASIERYAPSRLAPRVGGAVAKWQFTMKLTGSNEQP